MIKEGTSRIEKRKRDCTLDDIYNIAYTSLDGNKEMATTIHNIYKECGLNVFIDVKASYNSDTIVKIYKGMVYEAGYISPCFINTTESTCELRDANVYVFESPIDTPAMNGILRSIFTEEVQKPLVEMRANPDVKITPTIIICPKITRDANSFLDKIEAYYNGIKDLDTKPKFCIVSNLSNTNNYLLDIMNLTGAKFIKKYIDNETYQKDIEDIRDTVVNKLGLQTINQSRLQNIILKKIENKSDIPEETEIEEEPKEDIAQDTEESVIADNDKDHVLAKLHDNVISTVNE